MDELALLDKVVRDVVVVVAPESAGIIADVAGRM